MIKIYTKIKKIKKRLVNKTDGSWHHKRVAKVITRTRGASVEDRDTKKYTKTRNSSEKHKESTYWARFTTDPKSNDKSQVHQGSWWACKQIWGFNTTDDDSVTEKLIDRRQELDNQRLFLNSPNQKGYD